MQVGLRARKELEAKDTAPASVAAEAQLTEIVEDGEAAKTELIEANLRLVVSIAKKYQGSGVALLDLIAEGNLELTKIAEMFDPAKGIKFGSFAYCWIDGAIKRSISEQQETGAIRVPTRQYHDALRLETTRQELALENEGRLPAEAELCSRLGWTPRKLKYVLAGEAGGKPVLSLDWVGSKSTRSKMHDTAVSDVDGFGDRVRAQALIFNPSAVSEVRALHEAVRAARAVLQGRQSEIVERIFWGGQTNSEIAEHYGVKPQRIQQIKNDALLKLRNNFPDLYTFLEA